MTFDRGTIVLTEPGGEVDLATLPGVLWDPRVGVHRTSPYRCAVLLAELRARSVPLVDDTTSYVRPPDGEPTGLVLRDYQQAALQSWEAAGRRGVVVLPTGSGKTPLAVCAIARSRLPTLCLVPTRVLLHQWRATLEQHCAGPIGVLGDGLRTIEPITVATFEGAFRAMERIGNRFGLLIVDEVHHFGNGVRDEALEMCVAAARLGLTATPPHGEAAVRLAQLIGSVVYRLGVSDLAGGFLCPYDIVPVAIELDLGERAAYETSLAIFRRTHRPFAAANPGASWSDFVRCASRTENGRRALAAWRRSKAILGFPSGKRRALSHLLERHADARILVFTADNETAYTISREHLIMPLTCDIGPAERNDTIRRFREGHLRALVSAQVLNEGFDVPDAEIAIIVAGRFGEREYVQRVGRLLRPAPGKRARIYELLARGTSDVPRADKMREALAPRRPSAA
ncbi:MAG: DEAD/DEAH box helicase family protein [Myxococcales bacterium]